MNWILRHPGWVLAAALLLLTAGVLGLGLYAVIRPQRVEARAEPRLPAQGFDHAPLAALLERFVDREGQVDYAAWHADPEALSALEGYLANLAAASPRSAPERFSGEGEALSYWLNAYNACVIAGVLRHWPLGSVQDLRRLGDPVAGFGFFARLHFCFGGEWLSLHHLEQRLIRPEFPEPRVHFLLNCASGGCPILRPEVPRGSDLEERLEAAAKAFVNDSAQLQIDAEAKAVRVSAIFVWYEEDFLRELERRGLPPSERSLLRYLEDLAEPDLARALREARQAGFRVVAQDYDWSLNGG